MFTYKTDNNSYYPACSMLIDQKKYIDGDPVVYACSKKAMYTDFNHFYCEGCFYKLQHRLGNITIPDYNTALAEGNRQFLVECWNRTIKKILTTQAEAIIKGCSEILLKKFGITFNENMEAI